MSLETLSDMRYTHQGPHTRPARLHPSTLFFSKNVELSKNYAPENLHSTKVNSTVASQTCMNCRGHPSLLLIEAGGRPDTTSWRLQAEAAAVHRGPLVKSDFDTQLLPNNLKKHA